MINASKKFNPWENNNLFNHQGTKSNVFFAKVHTHTHTKVIALNFSIMNLTLTIKFTIKSVMLFLCRDITPAGAVIILNLRWQQVKNIVNMI